MELPLTPTPPLTEALCQPPPPPPSKALNQQAGNTETWHWTGCMMR